VSVTELVPQEMKRPTTAWAFRLLYLVVVIILLVRPSTLYPVGGEQCSFCFRQATGNLTYRAAKTGDMMTVSVCDSHRKTAPSSGTITDFGYFKLFVWIVMLGPSGFAFAAFGHALFFSSKPPPRELGGFGCLGFALVPMLIGQVLYLTGFHITGRITEWFSVFLMLSAMLGIATAPFMPEAKTTNQA
jgi:hypothetical protein